MKHRFKEAMIFLILLIAFGLTPRESLSVNAANVNEDFSAVFVERIGVSLNCTTAELQVLSMVVSNDISLVHFPPKVDMGKSEFASVASIIVVFTRTFSRLVFAFNNTDTEASRLLADSVKGTMEEAFEEAFTWSSTEIIEGHCVVTYAGPGKGDLTGYLSWLMDRCLAQDLGGFSLTFIPISGEENAFVEIIADRSEETGELVYLMAVGYYTSVPVGAGPHKIDFLRLLNVESLAPSKYASPLYWGTSSIVDFVILSNETVSYVTSEPGAAVLFSSESLAYPMSRGWYMVPSDWLEPPQRLHVFFSFGDSLSPVEKLTLTFSGLIIPEIDSATPLIALMLAASAIMVIKRKAAR